MDSSGYLRLSSLSYNEGFDPLLLQRKTGFRRGNERTLRTKTLVERSTTLLQVCRTPLFVPFPYSRVRVSGSTRRVGWRTNCRSRVESRHHHSVELSPERYGVSSWVLLPHIVTLFVGITRDEFNIQRSVLFTK